MKLSFYEFQKHKTWIEKKVFYLRIKRSYSSRECHPFFFLNELAGSNYHNIFYLIHKWLCIKVWINSYDKSYDHNFIDIWISIFRLIKNRRKNCKSSLSEFNISSNIFSLVKIFFRIQISHQLIKQMIIWKAKVFFFNLKRWSLEFSNRTHRHSISSLLPQQLEHSFPCTKYLK